MHPTAICLRRGFWGRSLEEFKRLSNIAIKLEGIKGPSGPLPLHDFHMPSSIQDCKLMCDVDIGGYSRASLDWQPPPSSSSSSSSSSPAIKGHAHFHGTISTALPPQRPEVQRSGFAAWRTRDRPPTIFGRALWDIDMYVYLALRVRSDGRSYLVNVQTEGVVPSDLHQHRLFARRPGEWETVLIRWNDFVRTNHGFVVEPQAEMLRQRVKSVGIGLTDRVPGPFDLRIESLWATNDSSEGESEDGGAGEEETTRRRRAVPEPETEMEPGEEEIQPAVREGNLRNKRGKQISWSEK